MLAVICALREWRCYLEGAREPFTLVTDCQSNVYLDTASTAHTIHCRAWLLSVRCDYNYNVIVQDNVADPISRALQHFKHLCNMVLVAHSVGALTAQQTPLQLLWGELPPSALQQDCLAQPLCYGSHTAQRFLCGCTGRGTTCWTLHA
jgi:hypothetical protein